MTNPRKTIGPARASRRLGVAGATALLLALVACGEEEDASSGPITVSDRAVVLTADDIDRYGPEVTWTPDASDVEAVDEALAEHRAAHPETDLEPYDDYFRQYVGTEGGAVHVNAMCDEIDGWQDSYVTVEDGGSCFWQASVRDGEVERWAVNGSA